MAGKYTFLHVVKNTFIYNSTLSFNIPCYKKSYWDSTGDNHGDIPTKNTP